MQLCFVNQTDSPLSLALAYVPPGPDDPGDLSPPPFMGCPDSNEFVKVGWWNLNPADSVGTTAYTTNRYFGIYAEAWDSGERWEGPYFTEVPYTVFDTCFLYAVPDPVWVGFAQIDAGWWSWAYFTFTVTLS